MLRNLNLSQIIAILLVGKMALCKVREKIDKEKELKLMRS